MESEEYDKRRSSTEDDRSTDLTSVSDDAAEPKSPTARAKPRVGRRVTSAQPAIRREEIPGTVQLALDKLAVPNRDRDCIGVLCDWKHQAPIHLKAVHFHKLSRALTARPNIMNLSLQGHGLADDASVEALADLVLQREIKQLDLSFCRIGDHNAAKLFELIALGKVEWLDMTYNILGVSSIPKIAQSISTSVCHLKVLSVRYNPITAVGLGTLVRYGTTLLTLDARCCGILTEENVEYRRKGFNTILKSIAANRTLNRMLVQGNGFTAGEEVLIIKAIESSDSAMTEESCLVSDPSVDPLLKSLKALNIGMRKHNEAQLEDVLNAKLDEKGFFSRTALPRLTFTPEETVAHFENIAELEEPVPDSPLVGYETPTMDIERRDTMPLGWRGSQSDGSARSFNSMTDLISLDQSNSFSRDIKRVSSVATLSMSVSSNSLRQKTACRRFLRRFNSESDDISVARLDTMPLDSIRTHNRSTWGLLGSIMKTMADTPRGVHQRKLSVNSSSAEMMAEASKFVNYKEITKQRRTSVDLPSPPTSMLTTSPEAHKTAAKKRPLTTPDAKDPSNPATPPPAVGGGPAEKPGGRSQAAAPGGAKPALDQNRKTQASRLGRSGNGVAAAAPVVVPKKAAGGAAQAQQPAKKPAAKAAAAPRAEDPGDEPTGLRLTATTLESLAENGSFSRTFDSTFNNNRNSVDDALDHQFFNATAQKKFAEADGSSGVQPAGGADAALPFPGSAATRRKSSFNEDAFFAKTGIHGPMDDDDDDNEFSGVNALFAPVPMLLDDVEQQFAGGAPMSFSGATHGSQGRSNSLSDALVSFVFPFDGSVGPAAAEEADSKDTNASTATDDADPDPKPSAEGRGVAADGGSPPGASITPFLQDIEEPAAGTGRKTTEPLIPFTLSGDDAHAFPRTKTAPQEEAVAVGSRDAANDNNSTASSNLRFRAKDTWGSDCGDSVLKVETASSASSSPTNSTKKQEKNAGSGNNNNNNNNNNSSSGKAAERGGRAAARAKGTAAAGPASPRGRSQGGRQDAQGRGKDGGGGRAGSSSSSHRNNNNNNNNNNHHHPSNHNNNNNNNNNSSGSPGGKNNGKDVSDSNNNDDSNDNNNNSGRRARSSSSHRSHKGRPPVSPRGAGGGGRKGKNEAESASESPANDAVEIRRVDSFELMSPRSEIGTPKCPPLDLPLHGLDKLPKKLPSCQVWLFAATWGRIILVVLIGHQVISREVVPQPECMQLYHRACTVALNHN
ncbi:hypothetical protein DIPPA_24617 [Diplonema papillatum]|nr:hypothetical protein DIPPA_24617 [Diplonema papillatum]